MANERKARNTLSFKQAYILMNLVRDKYTASGQNDSEFAAANEGAVGHTLTGANVCSARAALNIPNNFARPAPKQMRNLEDRVADLETALGALQDALGVTRQ